MHAPRYMCDVTREMRSVTAVVLKFETAQQQQRKTHWNSRFRARSFSVGSAASAVALGNGTSDTPRSRSAALLLSNVHTAGYPVKAGVLDCWKR